MSYMEKQVTIINELGLHTRCAAQIANIARTAKSRVVLKKNEQEVDAADIMSIIGLECRRGTILTINTEDSGDIDVLNSIENLIKNGFGE